MAQIFYEVDINAISSNIDQLVKAIDLKDLKLHLFDNGAYTERTMAVEAIGRSASEKTESLLFGLKKKSPEALSKFVKSLSDAGQYKAAKILCPDFEEPPPKVLALRQAVTPTSPTAVKHGTPFHELPNVVHRSMVNPVLADPEELEEEEYLGQEIIAHTLPDITRVTVKRAVQKYGGANPSSCYHMESKPRGFALIFVNEFKARIEEQRHGASKDKELLQELFTQFGYEVKVHHDTSKYRMKAILKDFTSWAELKSTDSCVVVISSHGDKDSIVCEDMQTMPVKDITDMFNNEKCPNLSGKPKLFIIQACRGGTIDAGVVNREFTDDPRIGYSIPIYKPTVTDIMIAYSTTPGYVARRTIRGSWYIYVLTEVFMKRAWNKSLHEMLMKVNRRMNLLKTEGGLKQSAETVWQGWHKTFFFNPGL